ncbi:Valine--pyruvate aminotransferase [groundwater metagenome]
MFSRKSENLPPFHVMEVLERAHELERTGRSIIHLEIGEPDFPTAPHICEAAMAALKAGETKYTHSLGIPELREAVAEYYNSRFGLDISEGQVIVTSRTSPAMLLLFMGLLEHDDEVIMSNPYYACYPNFVEYQGGKPVFVYTNEEDGFSPEPDSMTQKMTSNSFVQHAGIAALRARRSM